MPWLGWTSLGGINSTAVMFTEMCPSMLLFLSSLAKIARKAFLMYAGVLLASQQESSSEGYIRGFLFVVGDVEDVTSPFMQFLQGRLWGEVRLPSPLRHLPSACALLSSPSTGMAVPRAKSQRGYPVPRHSETCPPFFNASLLKETQLSSYFPKQGSTTG